MSKISRVRVHGAGGRCIPLPKMRFQGTFADIPCSHIHSVGISRQEALRRLLFVEYKDWSEGSTAALRVASYMRQPWPMVAYLRVGVRIVSLFCEPQLQAT